MAIEEDGVKIELQDDIKAGHKVALRDIKKGEDIIKYGYPIGQAKEDISKGQWVHTHNTVTKLKGTMEYNYSPKFVDIPKREGPISFMAIGGK